MTRISTIHGIGADEYAGRAAMVTSQGYIPYLSLTVGEMELYLAAQRARIMAQWYGNDGPKYREAVTMIDNALHTGVHNGINWINAVPNELQGVAQMITQARRQTQPASRALFHRPGGVVRGIGEIIPVQQRFDACMLYAVSANSSNERNRRIKQCKENFEVEKILNGALEKSSHHVIYKQIPGGYTVPSMVANKELYHKTGVEGLASAGEIVPSLMYGWTEVGVLARNAQSAQIGPIGSVQSSVLLAPDPEASWANLSTWANGQDPKKIKMLGIKGIGVVPIIPPVDPVTAGLNIVIAIAGALTVAATLLKELRSAKAYAMNEAQGFGTSAFQANPNDWLNGAGNPNVTPGAINPMWLLAGGAALFLLMDDK
jgi:hypothetical protein